MLVLCGDLTDYGLPEEAQVLRRGAPARAKMPTVAVLGNHDYESGQPDEVRQDPRATAGVTMLDGEPCEVHGIGFAGVKGFAGGFGRGTLGAWGEAAIKQFVQEAIDEALKLESALARLRTPHSGSPCCTTRRSARRSRASRSRSSRSSAAAAWKSR